MNADQTALVQRFNGFLQKIDDRLTELINEAEAGLGALFAEHPDDPLVVGNAISGLDYQIQQLHEKVNSTWEGQIEGAFSALDSGGAFLDVGIDRKEDFLLALDERWQTFKGQAAVAFYQGMQALAEQAAAQEFRCRTCSATLEPPVRYESVSLTCPYCHAVNQVIPSMVVCQYYGTGAAHAVAEAAALPLRFAIERYRVEVNRDRRHRSWGAETIQQLEKWEQMELAFWTKYVEGRGEHLRQPPDQELLQSRMKAFRQYNLENNQVWRKAKGR
jgi:hypothetical protein